ncbi:MAG: hypothetical protein A4E35_00851 [Methanoregula sp. PtaU1.Bin051]|nr:MAG: hypothetical protein A4E35_00851 [Methanoregula sp. PtaU1.Bin051]
MNSRKETVSIYLSLGITYVRRMRYAWRILLTVLVVVAVLSVPVSAKIQYTADVRYDASGTLPGFGEEIPVTLVIAPGENAIKNLVITLREADAFIDDSNPSFITKKISPAGASINITQSGLSFMIDQLQQGQTITIDFIAYPKTLQQQKLHVADVGFSYTQMGDRIDQPYEPVYADMSGSSWFQLQSANKETSIVKQNAETETRNAQFALSIGFVLVIVAIVIIAYVLIKRGSYVRECAALKESKNQLMHEILRKVELAENNKAELESLKKRLRTELGPDTHAVTAKTGETVTKSTYKDDKDSGFE